MTHPATFTHPTDPPAEPWSQTSPWAIPGIVDRLKALWPNEVSGKIADILSVEFNITLSRAAVTGKLDRLGLLGKAPTPMNPEEKKARKREHEARWNMARRAARAERLGLRLVEKAPSAPIAAPVHGIEPLNLTLAELPDNGCHFIPDALLYCGHKVLPGLPYCAHHAAICYRPVEQRVRR